MLYLFVKYKERFLYSFEIANVANISYAFMLTLLMQYQKLNSCCPISTDVTIKSTFYLHFFRINPCDLKIPLLPKAKLRTCLYISKLFLAPGVCVWSDIIISILFNFGTPKSIYQMKALGEVGGALGRFLYAEISSQLCWFFNSADTSAYMLKFQQHKYHKLKNCRGGFEQ